MRILITGASGMLGSTAAVELGKSYEVYATGNTTFESVPFENYQAFDLGSEDYTALLDWADPDVILHAAALTNGNFCQENPVTAFDLNGVTLDKFIRQSKDHVKIIYISTDAVFSSSSSLSLEDDCVSPENVYGKSKELGEFFLRNSAKNYCILRTTIVGLNILHRKNSFVEWIINAANSNEKIGLFNDVFFNPISIWDFIEEIKTNIIPNDIKGIYHLAGSEVCTKYEFGSRLIHEMNLSDEYLSASSILSFADRAKRCTDQTLSVEKYEREFQKTMPTIEQTIKAIKNNYNE